MVSTITTLLLICIFIVIYFPTVQKNNLHETLESKHHALAHMISIGVGLGIEKNDHAAVLEALNWTRKNKETAFTFVLNESHKEIASINPSNMQIHVKQLLEGDEFVKLDDNWLHILNVPVIHEKTNYGKLIIGFTLNDYYDQIETNSYTAVIISIILLIIGSSISFIFSKTTTKSLKKLTEAANKISSGDYHSKVEIISDDEVGQMSKSFNDMSENLIKNMNLLNEEIEERKKIESKIEKQNQFFHTVIDSFTQPFYVINVEDYSIEMANSAAKIGNNNGAQKCHLLQHKSNQPCNSSEHPCPIEIIKETKQPVTLEHIHEDEDGNTVNVEIQAYPIFDDDGNVVQMIEYTRDITEHKEMDTLTDALLNISKSVTQTENISELISEIHKQVERLMYAKNFYVCLVHDLEKNLFTFPYHKDENTDEVQNPYEPVELTSGLTYHVVQTRNLLKGNKNELKKIGVIGTIPKSWLGAPIKTESGEMMGVIAVQNYKEEAYTDKHAQLLSIIARNIASALKYKKAEQEMSTIISELPFGMMIVGKDKRIKKVNKAALKILQLDSEDEVVGNLCNDKVCPADKDKCPVLDLNQTVDSSERVVLGKNGIKIPVLKSVLPIMIGNEHVLLESFIDISDRKNAEKALKDSEEKYKDISRSIGEWLWEVNQELKFIYSSGRIKKILGYSSEELIGKTLISFIKGPEKEKVSKNFSDSRKKQKPIKELDVWLYNKLGKSRCLSISGVPVFSEEGKWIGFRGVGNDITEIKNIEFEKRIFNELSKKLTVQLYPRGYAKIVADSAYELFEYDAFSLSEVDWDKNMLEDLYIEDTEINGDKPKSMPTSSQTLDSIVNKDVLNGKAKLINRKKEESSSNYAKFGNKQRLSKSLMFVPIQFKKRTIGIISVQSYTTDKYDEEDLKLFQDFGDHIGGALLRAQIGEALKENEEKFKKITTSAHDGMIMMDSEGNVSFWNPAAKEIFGYSKEEVLGENLHNIIAPKDLKKAHLKAFKEFQKTGEGAAVGKTLELPGLRNDGKQITVELSLSSMKLHNKWCSIGILRDISQRKEEEEKLLKTTKELEETNKHLEEATIKAKEYAEKSKQANKAKSEFLANMSHEIRTPMNGVIGMTGLLLDSNLKPEQKEYAESIRISGESLLTIINDILDFSKIESGKLELEMQIFSLHECIEEAMDIIAVKAEEKHLELIQVIDKSVSPSIIGDVTRLRQILVNLLNNAVKFTDNGEIVLSASAKKLDEKYHEFHLSVRDTGIGIPKDRMNKLFKSFSQVDASTTRKYGGTGLGLTISKKLSEIMGGKMWVESEEGKGSTFHFTIKAEPVKTSAREYLEDPSPVLKDKKVLIVDDNAMNRKLVTLQVESWDMQATAVASGKEALGLLKSQKVYDLGILDMQMPEMDGEQLAQEIRKLTNGKNIPLMMLTSLGKRSENSEVIEKYFSAYLLKPIKQSQLYNAIISIFERRKTEDKYKKRDVLINSGMAKELPLRILVAEDNVINQKVADRILQKMGYRADIVGNGKEVIESLKDIPYDVIFMDVQMPEMDGLTATREICKKWSKERRPRIIAMTANAMKGDREMCLEAGMDDYISKPIRVNELVKVLKKNGKTSV